MFCLPWTGHLNPFAALAQELQNRGHDVVFFQLADFGEAVRKHGFEFQAYGEKEFPPGALAERNRELARLSGLVASRAGLDILRSQAEAVFTSAPALIERARLDLWVVDHLDYATSTLAASMGAPFVSLIVGLMLHWEAGVPGFSGEIYSSDPAVIERDRQFREKVRVAAQPFRDFIGAYRVKSGMTPFSFETLWSRLAQITQQPREFEFPRKRLPACFHFTGPFASRTSRPESAFPWERLNGKPLIYASFGTTQNRNAHLFEAVIRAAADLDAQVVLSMGGTEAPPELSAAAGPNVLIADFVPQLEILPKAALMITHAGMNSALECLEAGVPMVATPIAHDQSGVAARIEWTGTGVRIPAQECEPVRLRGAIDTVLRDPAYRAAARRFQEIIAKRQGLKRAADIIERVTRTGLPVLREDSFAAG